MTDPVTTRLSVEGADLLLLAGVNDANLVELSRATGARVALRGDALTISGEPESAHHHEAQRAPPSRAKARRGLHR